MALNHIQITNAKPRDKAYKLADSDGLYLFIQPNGAKLWRMNYRHLGRQKTLYFGAWPEVGIAAARQHRDKAREQIAAGLDPAAEKRIETLARKVAADNTFKTIAEEWVSSPAASRVYTLETDEKHVALNLARIMFSEYGEMTVRDEARACSSGFCTTLSGGSGPVLELGIRAMRGQPS
jgi:hypothetical protein